MDFFKRSKIDPNPVVSLKIISQESKIDPKKLLSLKIWINLD
jgi:hypothetical protein